MYRVYSRKTALRYDNMSGITKELGQLSNSIVATLGKLITVATVGTQTLYSKTQGSAS